MNTRFDTMGPEVVLDYFNKSLLYDIFPSFFNGTYMQDGKWVNVHYFKDAKFYERDRHLFKKYIPILRRMFDAGWQPVTHARRTEPAAVRVERYGPSASGEALFAVYNPSASAVTAKLTVDAAALALKAPLQTASALVAGSALPCQRREGQVELSVPLAAKACEVIRLGP
jgi:hypothetical protein